MSKILASPGGARVVNLSSNGYKSGAVRFGDCNFGSGTRRTMSGLRIYGQSKSANILYARGLAERYGRMGLRAFVGVHPGGIWTNLGNRDSVKEDLKALGFMDENGKQINTDKLTWKTLGQGVSTTIVAAFDPSIADRSGAYMEDGKVKDTAEDWMQDPDGPQKLWRPSKTFVGQEFRAPA